MNTVVLVSISLSSILLLSILLCHECNSNYDRGTWGGLLKDCWGHAARHWVRSSAGTIGTSNLIHTGQRHQPFKFYNKSRRNFLWNSATSMPLFLSLLPTPCSLLTHLLQQPPSFSLIVSICLYSWFSFLNLFSKQLLLKHCPSCFLCYLPNYMCSAFWHLWHFMFPWWQMPSEPFHLLQWKHHCFEFVLWTSCMFSILCLF